MSPPVAAVVLAAGLSRRFGQQPPKPLALFRGEPLVRRVVELAASAGLAETVVVIGHEGERVRQALEGAAVRIVANERYTSGQASSVAAGLAAVSGAMTGALFLPCDQPLLTPEVLRRLLAAHAAGGAIVVPVCEGRRRGPVLFSREFFPALAGLAGDAGGRQLFAANETRVVAVPFDHGAPFADVDTAEDLETLANGSETPSAGMRRHAEKV